MRRSILLILVATLGLTITGPACHKSSGQRDELTGTWELYALDGGIAGRIIYAPGSGPTYHFFSNGTFLSSSSGSAASGIYRLAPASLLNYDKILTLTWSLNSAVTRDSVRITGNELSFLPTVSCCDMAYYVYRRTSYF